MKKDKGGNFYAVVLAGGGGQRFWPWSRADQPKQLLPFVGKPYPNGKTLMETTLARIKPLFDPDHTLLITTEQLAPKLAKLLPKVPRENIVAEPMGRNTAAAVALGATLVQSRDPQGVMAVLPADHLINDEKRFLQVLHDAGELAAKNPLLITIGIKPTDSNPAYGYIHVGDELPLGKKTHFYRSRRFIEKPDEDRARGFVSSGEYRWNAGIFVGSVMSFSQAFGDFAPDLYAACGRWSAAIGKKNFESVLRKEYEPLKYISIDHAVMERAVNVIVAEADIGWDDLGSWAAYARQLTRDEQGNALLGNVVAADARDCLIIASGKKPIALAGVSGVVVVETDDAILVTHKRQAHKVKNLVAKLAEESSTKKLI